MAEFGKLLVIFGVILAAAGLVLILLDRNSLPLGRLPGDFLYRGKNTTVYFPLVTSLLFSVVVSLILYLINRFRR
jgi:H+/Cl- antiporter ClcA